MVSLARLEKSTLKNAMALSKKIETGWGQNPIS
jgi:hypothetical protein